MAYNLPPPWDPGYALPENVRDEGLERRGLVTKWAPRGTYDNPRVGSGGYVLPANVRAERYGQGTYTTKWLPRGYVDEFPPHRLNQRPRVLADRSIGGRTRAVTMAAPIMVQPANAGATQISGFGDDLHPLFTQYGERAADVLLRAVAGMPQAAAKAKLKKLMDAVDPTLWGRTATLTRGYLDQGYRGIAALRAGLAAAMSSGIAAEIIRTGLSRTAPQARSLLGLGCYGGAAALGADTAIFQAPTQTSTAMLQVGASGPVYCKGRSWTGTAWTVTRVGYADAPGPPGVSCPVGVEHTSGPATGSGGAPKDFSAAPPITEHSVLKVGIFTVPANAKSVAIKTTLTDAQVKYVRDQIVKLARVSMSGPLLITGKAPFVRFRFPESQSPNSGKLFGLFYNQADKPTTLMFKEYVPDTGIVGAIWDAVVEVASFIVDTVKDAIDAVGDLACGLINNPAVTVAAAAAAGAAGVPPAAGAQGATIAQQQCGTAPPPTLPPGAASESSSMLPVAIIGGAALVAILLSKKRSPTP